jgi:hypothetical protein
MIDVYKLSPKTIETNKTQPKGEDPTGIWKKQIFVGQETNWKRRQLVNNNKQFYHF